MIIGFPHFHYQSITSIKHVFISASMKKPLYKVLQLTSLYIHWLYTGYRLPLFKSARGSTCYKIIHWLLVLSTICCESAWSVTEELSGGTGVKLVVNIWYVSYYRIIYLIYIGQKHKLAGIWLKRMSYSSYAFIHCLCNNEDFFRSLLDQMFVVGHIELLKIYERNIVNFIPIPYYY